MDAGNDIWDDSLILDIFHQSVSSHSKGNIKGSTIRGGNKQDIAARNKDKEARMSPVNGSTKQSIGVKRKRPTNEPNGKRQLQSITKEDLLTQSLAGPWEPVSNNQKLDARSDINRNYPITDSQLNYTKSSGIADIEPGEVSDNNMETIIDADYFIEKSVRIKEYSDLKSTEVGDNVEDKAVERPQFVTEDTIPPLVNTYPENSILNKALNDMLSLWYQAGYATGRYNTLLEMQQKNSDAI